MASAGTLMPPAFPYGFLSSFSELRFCSLCMKGLLSDKCIFCLEIKHQCTFVSGVLLFIPRGHLCFLLPSLCILFTCEQFSEVHVGVISFICPTSLNYKSKTHALSIQVIIFGSVQWLLHSQGLKYVIEDLGRWISELTDNDWLSDWPINWRIDWSQI